MFYDESEGQPSPETSSVVTLPLTTPTGTATDLAAVPNEVDVASIVVSFTPPENGGYPILGYHTYAQENSGSTSMQWAFIGDFTPTIRRQMGLSTQHVKHELKIMNLLPDTAYRMKLIAFNELGDSAEHTITGLVTTLKVRKVYDT